LARANVVVLLVATAALPAAHATPNYDWPGMKRCGTFQAQYRIWVYAKNMRCRSARRIQKEYWLAPADRRVVHNGGSGALGWVTLTRYPGWRCSSGAGGGSCRRGEKIAGYQN
jgi:hypothetical protein